MKTFRVGVSYEVYGTVEVEAIDLADLKKRLKDEDFVHDMDLPEEPEYMDETYVVDLDRIEDTADD